MGTGKALDTMFPGVGSKMQRSADKFICVLFIFLGNV